MGWAMMPRWAADTPKVLQARVETMEEGQARMEATLRKHSALYCSGSVAGTVTALYRVLNEFVDPEVAEVAVQFVKDGMDPGEALAVARLCVKEKR